MDPQTQTMLASIEKITGKPASYWVQLVAAQKLEKHGQMVSFLKDEHGFSHGFANLIAHLAKSGGTLEKSTEADAFKGKEHFKPLYDEILSRVKQFGSDIEIAPKKSYVSLRRKKQFAILNPATKERFEIGLNLKDVKPAGKLEEKGKTGAMCSHRINLPDGDRVDQEVVDWLKKAYDQAG
ncbi:MAG: hypothetical protein TR69_WS6001001333 [candidate division WS6 bacterium OLB20]|uniref:DUF5655 domain-containing protein n=1 Tax=candidate division WS6 bacterium OLB20 TaxID=1617426 RepID=A0A136LWK3_9BACT|nr:MAG: hypothetical protein TR69_WS6001001333 [candidate division WS6 bacterium OLB20]